MIMAGCQKTENLVTSVPKRQYCVTIDNLQANCFNFAFIHISPIAAEEANSSSKSVLYRKTISEDVVRARNAEG